MKDKIKKVIASKELLSFSAITLIFFGIFIRFEFATDTYASLSMSIRTFINQFGSSGRFIIAFCGTVLKLLKIKNDTVYLLSFLMAIVCMILSLYKLYNIIKDDIKDEKLKKIIPVLIVLNAFSIELFLFIEKGIMIFAILMCIFAVDNLVKGLDKKDKRYFIISAILMFMANCSYQGVVGIFVAIAIVYILKYSKTIKEFIINNVITILVYGVPATVDFALTKIFFAGSRVSGEVIISQSIKKVCSSTFGMIKNTYQILPKYFLFTLIIIVILILIGNIIMHKKTARGKVLDIFKVIYIVFGVIFASVAPQLMQNTESIWFVARSTYPYASLFGVLVLYLFMNYDVKKVSKAIVITLSVLLIIVEFYRFNIIETDRYKLNEVDYEITKAVCEKIDEYEQTTGNQITKIAIYSDSSVGYTYDGIFATGDTNLKSYFVDWSILYTIQYYSGRSLQKIEPIEEIKVKFLNENWNSFDKDQLIFDDDTLHFCKY